MTAIRLSTSWSACCASGRTVIDPPRRAAQDFADHLNGVLNRTISDSRLSLIELPNDPSAFELTRVEDRVTAPLELRGTAARLLMRQLLVVVDGHCRIESYTYRLQSGDEKESWLIRWEYHREPPRPDYAYPAAHLHVHGEFPGREPIGRLHIPTRRVPLELVVWHLIAERGAESKADDWQTILTEPIEGFRGAPDGF